MSKTDLTHVGIGDLLKWEATPLTRVEVDAPKGTKAGALVNYPLRNKKLVVLTDEADGKVIVQPHNCIINAEFLKASEISTAFGGSLESPVTLADMAIDYDQFGIVYVGTPKP